MTINKAQEQTLERVGIYLPEQVFPHWQLYVAQSRVKTGTANFVQILIQPTSDETNDFWTTNIIYKEILTEVEGS